jgi:hypothetical protein
MVEVVRGHVVKLGEIKDIAHALEQEQGTDTPESFADCRFWIGSLQNQIRTAARDLNTLVAWARRLFPGLCRLWKAPDPSLSRACRRSVKQ